MGKIIFPTEMAQCHLYMNDNLRSVNNTVFITFILYIQATLNKVLLGTIFLCSCTKNLFFFFFFLINCIQYIWFLLLFGSYQVRKSISSHIFYHPLRKLSKERRIEYLSQFWATCFIISCMQQSVNPKECDMFHFT